MSFLNHQFNLAPWRPLVKDPDGPASTSTYPRVFSSDNVNYMDAGESWTFDKACSASDAELWWSAMQSEIDSIYKNNLWELVQLPANKKPIPCN